MKRFKKEIGNIEAFEVKDSEFKKGMIADESDLTEWIENNEETNQIFNPDEFDEERGGEMQITEIKKDHEQIFKEIEEMKLAEENCLIRMLS